MYNNIIDMDFLKKIEVIKQNRQSVINSGKKRFFSPNNTDISEIKDNENGCSI